MNQLGLFAPRPVLPSRPCRVLRVPLLDEGCITVTQVHKFIFVSLPVYADERWLNEKRSLLRRKFRDVFQAEMYLYAVLKRFNQMYSVKEK